MILCVNGPFGVGKTTAATLLVHRLPHAMVYDPEIVDTAVRYLLTGVEQADDYQDHGLWRRLTVDVARRLRETTGRSLVVPMSVTRRAYVDVVLDGFQAIDPELVCFRLLAPPAVLQGRIMESDDVTARDWRLAHLESGLRALHDPAFGIAIRTNDCSPAVVVDLMMRSLPPKLGSAQAAKRNRNS